MPTIHTINASDKTLGRLATGIAVILMGKHKSSFSPHKDEGDFVAIKNIKGLKVSGKKMKQKKYFHHTGYIGHLKKATMGEVFAKNPEEILRKAVLGMLPKNKLRAKRIKRLSFTD
jgi:large subunit ribosomal protein L13